MMCSIANCENSVRARGWCNGHYERWRKTGDPGTAVLEQRRQNMGRRCAVESCSRTPVVRRMCVSHYARWKRHGDPGNTPIQEAASIEARFWQKVDKSGDCWVWVGAVSSSGYGHFQTDGGVTTAHRAVYQLLVGPIPDGLHIDHLCRNKLCVNPEHLEPVTQAENNRRAALVRVS